MVSRLARIRSRLRMGSNLSRSRQKKRPRPRGRGLLSLIRASNTDSGIPEQNPSLVEQIGRAVEGEDEVTTHGVARDELGGTGRLQTVGAQQLAEHLGMTGRGALSTSIYHPRVVVDAGTRITSHRHIAPGHKQDPI